MHGCNFCFASRTPCDMGRPCQQCVQRGSSHLCTDGPATAAAVSSTSASSASFTFYSPWPTSPTFGFATPSSVAPELMPSPPHHLGSPPYLHLAMGAAATSLSPPPPSSSSSPSYGPAGRTSTSATGATASRQPTADGRTKKRRRSGGGTGKDRDLGTAGGYAAADPIAALLQAVDDLTAEVRDLVADNGRLKAELKAMHAQQNAADRLLASVMSFSPSAASPTLALSPSLLNSERRDDAPAGRPRAVKNEKTNTKTTKKMKATGPEEPNQQTQAEPPLPPSALVAAVHELPFLRDYPNLAGFAIPDFRHPVLVCMYSYKIFDPIPPSILYVNAAMSELTGYTWQELIGAPLSKVLVMQEKWHRAMGPHLSGKDPLSLSPAYSFNNLLRTKSGRLYRGIDDCTQFFFGHDGTPKHAVLHVSRWEEGRLREGEAVDHWVGVRLDLPQIALPQRAPDAQEGHDASMWSLPQLSPARVVACDDDDQASFSESSILAMQPSMTAEDMAQMLLDTPASTPASTYPTTSTFSSP